MNPVKNEAMAEFLGYTYYSMEDPRLQKLAELRRVSGWKRKPEANNDGGSAGFNKPFLCKDELGLTMFEKSWTWLFGVWEKLQPMVELYKGYQEYPWETVELLKTGLYTCNKAMVHEQLYDLLVWVEIEQAKA